MVLFKHTIPRKLGPDAINTRHDRLTSKSALSTNLFRQVGDLSSKLLQLVHHRVDRVLELSNLRIFLHGVNEHLFAEITICDGCDDRSDFLQHLLVRGVYLRILLDLALQLLD